MSGHRRLSTLVSMLVLAACQGPSTLLPTTGALSAVPLSVDFGELPLGATARADVSFSNTGRSPLELTVSPVGPFVPSPGQLTLAGGTSAIVTIAFTPVAEGPVEERLEASFSGGLIELSVRGLGGAPCVPSGPCRESAWASSTCVETPRPDGTSCSNRCALSGTCSQGECLVDQLNPCDDGDACTQDACSQSVGCLHSPLVCPSAPCQAAVCAADAGCGLIPVDDGTPCGTASCASALVCVNGACVTRATPNAQANCLYTDLVMGETQACALTRGGSIRCWTTTRGPEPFLGRRNDFRGLAGGWGDMVCGLTATETQCRGAYQVVSASGVSSWAWWGLDGGPTDLATPGCAASGVQLDCPEGTLPDGGAVHLLSTRPWRGLTSAPGRADISWCASDGEGQVWCWGTAQPITAIPLPSPASRVMMATDVACALAESGDLSCWEPGSASPTLLWSGDFIDASATAAARVCALHADGGLRCTRSDEDGLGAPGAQRVALGSAGGCLLLGSGELRCWGTILGEPRGPEGVNTLPGANAASLDVSQNTVAVSFSDGGGMRFGGNFVLHDGGLVFAEGNATITLPHGGALREVLLPAGRRETVGLLHDGSLWSTDRIGAPGGSLDVCRVDAGVVAAARAQSSSSGFCHALESGEVWCGEDQLLAAGPPVRGLRSVAGGICALVGDGGLRCGGQPLEFDAGTRVKDLCAFDVNSSAPVWCVVVEPGIPYCNFPSNTAPINPATPLPGAWPETRSISCGLRNICAVSGSGGVQCWGLDLFAPEPWSSPLVSAQPIPLSSPAVEVRTDGYNTACARLTSGAVQCWGGNELGQRGVPRMFSSPTPIPMTR